MHLLKMAQASTKKPNTKPLYESLEISVQAMPLWGFEYQIYSLIEAAKMVFVPQKLLLYQISEKKGHLID